MLIGIFSDAHSNEIGFYQCYDFLKKNTDKIYYLGDAVGYFPLSNNIINTLRTDKVNCLKGNHDAMFLGELNYEKNWEDIYQLEKYKLTISEKNLSFLKNLNPEKTVTINNRNLLFIHGSPLDALKGYVYPDTDITSFEKLPYDAIFMGHTHRSFIKKTGQKYFVNVGSCGLPRDSGNKLTVGLYDTQKNEVSIKEFEMDVTEVLRKYGAAIHITVQNVLTRNNKNFHNE